MGGFGSGRPRTKYISTDFVRWAWKDCFGTKFNQTTPDSFVDDRVLGPYRSRWTNVRSRTEIDHTDFSLHLCGNSAHFLRFRHSAGTQDIQLEWLPRHLGGGRWVLRCPYTSKRCWVLYRPIASTQWGFASRQNWRMNYASEFMHPIERATEQLTKVRRQLGDRELDLGQATKQIQKPPRMHWKTYHRLVEKAEMQEARHLHHMAIAFRQLTRGSRSD